MGSSKSLNALDAACLCICIWLDLSGQDQGGLDPWARLSCSLAVNGVSVLTEVLPSPSPSRVGGTLEVALEEGEYSLQVAVTSAAEGGGEEMLAMSPAIDFTAVVSELRGPGGGRSWAGRSLRCGVPRRFTRGCAVRSCVQRSARQGPSQGHRPCRFHPELIGGPVDVLNAVGEFLVYALVL
eukprot:379667-Hanusia_phi.AAC.1